LNKILIHLFFVTILIIPLILYTGFTFYKFYKIEKATYDTRYIYKNLPFLTGQVVLFGDSRIKSWSPEPIFENLTVINRGVSGETTTQMMFRFELDALIPQPDYLIIQAGINDLVLASMESKPLEKSIRRQQCIDNLRNILDQATAKGINVILLSIVEPYKLGVIRSVLWGKDLTELVREVNKQIYSTHSEYLINTNNILPQSRDVKKDALHFTDKAYEILNGEIYSHIKKHYY
jgi:lysophospholipase L1-like esterase